MRLATWNVNSLRARIGRVEAFCVRNDVDVLTMQEVKATYDQVPLMGLAALGYEVAVCGNGQWNGVAIASRVGLDEVTEGFAGQPGWGEPAAPEARALGATCGGLRVWSLYVPNGRTPHDAHYAYKLEWMARLREAAQPWLAQPTVLTGDWNVCPTDEDVFDMSQFRNSTHVTPEERAAFAALLADGYAEVTRAHAPGYTYWDYYRQRFERDRGLKIDFVLASPSVAPRITSAHIDRDERDPAQGEGSPSDHAPVIVDLDWP